MQVYTFSIEECSALGTYGPRHTSWKITLKTKQKKRNKKTKKTLKLTEI